METKLELICLEKQVLNVTKGKSNEISSINSSSS